MYKDNNDPEKEENIKAEQEKAAEASDAADAESTEPISASVTPEPEEKAEKPEKKAAKSGDKVAFYKKRSFKFGSMATAFTVIFIAILVVLNTGLTVLSNRFPLSADLTKSKDFGLQTDTISFLKKMTQPVVIKVFATKQQMEGQQVLTDPAKILVQYPKYTSKIKIEYIDYDKNPTAVAQYSSENIQQFDIVVTTADNKTYKKVGGYDLLVTQTDSSTYQPQVIGNKAEQEIDSALDYVTTTVHPIIAFTTGHDEQDSSAFQTMLKGGNYTVQDLNTGTAKSIASDITGLAIVAPKSDFSPAEIDLIDKFLKNDAKYGKNLFLFLDPTVESLPNLEEYASEWGVKVEKGAIYDSKNYYGSSVFDVGAGTVDSTTTGVTSTVGTDIRIARPLTALFDTKDARTVTSIIKTGDTSQLLTNLKGSPAGSDQKGPFTTMTLSTWSSGGGSSVSKSNMIISGSYRMLDNDLISAPNLNNSKVMLGVVNSLMGKESSLSVLSKYNSSTSLNLTSSQRLVIIVIMVVLIPIVILLIGLIQWLRRRHL